MGLISYYPIGKTSIVDMPQIVEAEQLDSNSAYDTSNSRFTPGVAGYYYIGAVWRYDTGTDFDDARLLPSSIKLESLI